MFVRDGRTLPFVPVTSAALAAITAAVPARRIAYARSLYLALLELANDNRADRAAVTRKVLGERSGCSRDLVSDLRPLLEAAGVVRVHERTHGGQVLEHEWVVVEPVAAGDGGAEERTPVAASHDPLGHGPRLSLEEEEESGRTLKKARAREDAFPDDLPPELEAAAIEAGKVLKRTALTRKQPKAVTRAAVGHAVLTYADRDHVQVAREVEGWLLHGRGASKPCRDVVARFRNFLANADARAAPALAGNVAPLHGRNARIQPGDFLRAADQLAGRA